jgi:hypothetical protein
MYYYSHAPAGNEYLESIENVWAESETKSNPTSGQWIVWINFCPRTGNDLLIHGVASQVVLLARKGWSSI